MNRPSPLWPRIPAAFTAAALHGHSVLGLACGALVYLVCLTGTVSVFVDELRLVEQPRPAAAPLRLGALDRAVESALTLSRAPMLYALAPTTPRQRLRLEGGGKAWVADAEGVLTPERTPWTRFVTDLHMTLTAPAPWGALIVGLSGAALLSLILSGVSAHPRIFRDAFRLRLSGSRRLREAELHNRLSVWGLPFHLAVTLTGAFFGLAALTATALSLSGLAAAPFAPMLGPEVRADFRAAPMADVEELVRRAEAETPGSVLSYVGVERPGVRGARYTVEVAVPGRLPRGEQVHFDAAGRRIGRTRFVTGAPGLQTFSASAQVHFGFFGGLPVRIAYGVLGAALTYVAASGVTIWLARRRDRGRPAPSLERLWSGWTWGVLVALTLSALLALWMDPAPVFWATACGCAGLRLLLPFDKRLAKRSASSDRPTSASRS